MSDEREVPEEFEDVVTITQERHLLLQRGQVLRSGAILYKAGIAYGEAEIKSWRNFSANNDEEALERAQQLFHW